MIKLMIATPAYDGKLTAAYAISLAHTKSLLDLHGIEVEFRIHVSGSLLCAERNRLIKGFLESDCTHILCVDGDLGWPATSVLSMIKKNEDFIAGVYPTRADNMFLFRPVYLENGSIAYSDKQLLEMNCVSAGFMLIKRSVFQTIADKFPERFFEPKIPEKCAQSGYLYFNSEIYDGEFWGEDYSFCNLARKAGIKIWVDPFIEFDHAGVVGMMASTLTDKTPEEQAKEAALQKSHQESQPITTSNHTPQPPEAYAPTVLGPTLREEVLEARTELLSSGT